MKMLRNSLFFICLFGFIPGMLATASDLEKEQRWSDQIADALVVGEPVELQAGETAFLGLYAEATDGSGDRAAILVHGMGAHPDWPEVIAPLRSYLPDRGWTTLSIQMPVLANDATLEAYAPLFDEVAPRIDAATRFLTEKGIGTIVVIGHSLGASMAASYLVAERPAIKGFVAIGMAAIDVNEKMNSAQALEKISLPLLDIYGSRDLETVLATVKARAKASQVAENPAYRQLEIEGADHFFLGMEDTLNRRVYGWLKTTFEKPMEPTS